MLPYVYVNLQIIIDTHSHTKSNSKETNIDYNTSVLIIPVIVPSNTDVLFTNQMKQT